jgi:hypothetical protein
MRPQSVKKFPSPKTAMPMARLTQLANPSKYWLIYTKTPLKAFSLCFVPTLASLAVQFFTP